MLLFVALVLLGCMQYFLAPFFAPGWVFWGLWVMLALLGLSSLIETKDDLPVGMGIALGGVAVLGLSFPMYRFFGASTLGGLGGVYGLEVLLWPALLWACALAGLLWGAIYTARTAAPLPLFAALIMSLLLAGRQLMSFGPFSYVIVGLLSGFAGALYSAFTEPAEEEIEEGSRKPTPREKATRFVDVACLLGVLFLSCFVGTLQPFTHDKQAFVSISLFVVPCLIMFASLWSLRPVQITKTDKQQRSFSYIFGGVIIGMFVVFFMGKHTFLISSTWGFWFVWGVLVILGTVAFFLWVIAQEYKTEHTAVGMTVAVLLFSLYGAFPYIQTNLFFHSAARSQMTQAYLQCAEGKKKACIQALHVLKTMGDNALPERITLSHFACKVGDVDSCLWLASKFKRSLKKLQWLYGTACDYGSAEMCFQYGQLLEGDIPQREDPKAWFLKAKRRAWLLAYRRGCERGSWKACQGLLRFDALPPSDALFPELISFYWKKCEQDLEKAFCYRAGMLFLKTKGLETRQGMVFLRSGCQLGHAPSCQKLASIYAGQDGIGAQLVSYRYHSLACQFSKKHCKQRDALLRKVDADWLKPFCGHQAEYCLFLSKPFAERVCLPKTPFQCTEIGRMHVGVYGELSRQGRAPFLALDAFEHACRLGDTPGCYYLREILARLYPDWKYLKKHLRWKDKGKHFVRDIHFARRACTRGELHGCNAILSMLTQFLLGKNRFWTKLPGKEKVLSKLYFYGHASHQTLYPRLSDEAFHSGIYTLQNTYQKKSCRHGDGASCYKLGERLWTKAQRATGHAKERFTKQTVSFYKRGCEFQHADSCNNMGWALDHKHTLAKAPNRQRLARAYFKKACELGSGRGCGNWNRYLQSGIGGKKDPVQALKVARLGCKGNGDGYACFRVGEAYYYGRGTKQDYTFAMTSYQRGCQLYNAASCYSAGWLLLKGLGVQKNQKRSYGYFDRACGLNYKDGCVRLCELRSDYANVIGFRACKRGCEFGNIWNCQRAGYLLDAKKPCADDAFTYYGRCVVRAIKTEGDWATKDIIYFSEWQRFSAAFKFFEKACKGKEAVGCYNVANAYYYERGVTQNVKKAYVHYKRACDLGYAKGCREAAWSKLKGWGTIAEPSMARVLYEKGCKLKDGLSCEQVANLDEEADMAGVGYERINQYYQRACSLGRKGACSHLKKRQRQRKSSGGRRVYRRAGRRAYKSGGRSVYRSSPGFRGTYRGGYRSGGYRGGYRSGGYRSGYRSGGGKW
tara:strand:- start:4810 stop:8562 length:3753 start_codon:yes stop_codon:yes gene_type:complete